MSNTPQLQPCWRWPLWRYRSPQDVSAGHGRCHEDNPWKFTNNVIVWGTNIILRSVKPIGNEKKWWVSHYGVVYKLKSFRLSSAIWALFTSLTKTFTIRGITIACLISLIIHINHQPRSLKTEMWLMWSNAASLIVQLTFSSIAHVSWSNMFYVDNGASQIGPQDT